MLTHEGDPATTSILIAEDDGVVALELCTHFKNLGYRVAGPTSTGGETVARALAESPDVILLDMQLRGSVDGAAAALKIRKHLDVPIVFVTAHSDESTLARASSSEPDAYVLKPFEANSLGVTVRMALSRHRASKARAYAEAAQRRTERHFRLVLDHCHDAIVSVDGEGRITGFNRGAEKIFGASSEEMLGQPLRLLLPPDSASTHELEFQRFSHTGLAARAMGGQREVRGRRKSGELFPAEVNISSVKTDGDEVFIACIRDATERKALEEQFVQAQKMEVVGRLAASVAHDFNNVLTAIQSSAYLLKAKAGPGALEHLEDLTVASERGVALCRQLLGFSRQESQRLEVVNLNELIAGVEPLLRHLLPHNISLRLELTDRAAQIQVDPTIIEQILMNLVTNGRDAMPLGGEILIRSDAVHLGAADLKVAPTLRPGAHACLQVIDSGAGVPAAVAERIFEPFFTTKPRGLGTGLGLSTVRMLARMFGGEARFRSHPGRGTIFEVLLPLMNRAPGPLDAGGQGQRTLLPALARESADEAV